MSIANTIFFAVQVSQAIGNDASQSGPPTYPEPGVGIPSAGSAVPTYVYNVSDLSGNPLGTNMTPLKPNRPNPCLPGFGIGSGYNDQNGNFQLYDANEKARDSRPVVGSYNT